MVDDSRRATNWELRPSGWRAPGLLYLLLLVVLGFLVTRLSWVGLRFSTPSGAHISLWIPWGLAVGAAEFVRHAHHRSALWRRRGQVLERLSGLSGPRVRVQLQRADPESLGGGDVFAGLIASDQRALAYAWREDLHPPAEVRYAGGARGVLRYALCLGLLPLGWSYLQWVNLDDSQARVAQVEVALRVAEEALAVRLSAAYPRGRRSQLPLSGYEVSGRARGSWRGRVDAPLRWSGDLELSPISPRGTYVAYSSGDQHRVRYALRQERPGWTLVRGGELRPVLVRVGDTFAGRVFEEALLDALREAGVPAETAPLDAPLEDDR